MVAYSELYLEDAKGVLATAFEYGINILGVDIDRFSDVFAHSDLTKRFEVGNPGVVAGMSGVEFFKSLFDIDNTNNENDVPFEYGTAYWAGYSLAHYQWKSGYSFAKIIAKIGLREIFELYPTYHEMDIERFIEEMDRRMDDKKGKTNLRIQREFAGLSQRELSIASQVPLRSIQLYEQRVNDIDKAQGHTLYKLAYALKCSIEDILECPQKDK